jgi:hypothetical protein
MEKSVPGAWDPISSFVTIGMVSKHILRGATGKILFENKKHFFSELFSI